MKSRVLIVFLLLVFLNVFFMLLHGCSGIPPKNFAKRKYPSAEAMAKWTDFSGDYVVERIKDGWTFFPHRYFITEAIMRTNNAHIAIQQSGPTNMTLVYDRAYGAALATNALSFGKSATNQWTWVWDNGKAVYVEKYQGIGTMMPGSISANYTCIVSKNNDSSLTITSTKRAGGRLLCIIPWSDPENCSILKLVPVIQEQTNSVNHQKAISENN